MANDGAKWHWAEGMKYAIEGAKLIFMLNGAAAISVLTFIGNVEIKSTSLISAMVAFSLGSVSATLIMTFAYLAQLHYGNAEFEGAESHEYAKAVKFNKIALWFVAIGIFLFLIGIACAARGLLV